MAPRRRIKPQDKKLPSDYPQMAFRVTKATKTRLAGLIERVQTSQNNRRGADAPYWNKNDVIVQALEIGLAQMLKKPPAS